MLLNSRLSYKWLLTVSLALTTLSGCSLLEKLVYRIDINQGNFIEQPAVDKLRIGMNKEQVRYVLGSPMLIENGKPDIWHYIYHHTHGHNESIQKNLIATFDKTGLIQVEGDFEVSEDFYKPLN